MSDPASNARQYRVVHTTEYKYSDDVSVSYGRAHLMPRVGPGQVVITGDIVVDPTADEFRSHVDFFGNVSTYYAVRQTHRELRVMATSDVRVDRAVPSLAELDQHTWESARGSLADDVEARGFVLASPLIAPDTSLTTYATRSFTPGRVYGAALAELTNRIYTDFEYVSGATTVKTSLAEVLERRQGVCQDFAHLAVGCLRSVGLPARYVSGYIETVPQPGRSKLQGADASHAWASTFVADVGWVDIDPTNNQFVDSRYVVAGWGRDYSDVPPLKGVIMTNAKKSTLSVSVDVTRTG